MVRNELRQPQPQEDGPVIRKVTVAALDQAMNQRAAIWSAEPQSAQARREAEQMMRRAQAGNRRWRFVSSLPVHSGLRVGR